MSVVPWKFRGALTASYGSLVALDFDRTCDMLWSLDSYGHVTSYTPHVAAGQEEVQWHTYTSFRPFAEGAPLCTHLQFLNDGQETLVAFASTNQMRVTKRGGMTVFRQDAPPQRRISFFQTDFRSGRLYFAGETSGVHTFSFEAPSDMISSTAEGIVSAMRSGDDCLALGTSGGTLSLRHLETLETIHVAKPFASKITAIGSLGHTIAVSSQEKANSTVVKIFDTRQMAEAVGTITGIGSGTVTSLRVYPDADAPTGQRVLLLTPQDFHVLQADLSTPLYSSANMADGCCTAAAVSYSGTTAVVGNDKGCLMALSSPNETGFSNQTHPHPPPAWKAPSFIPRWQESKQGQADSGFDYDVPHADLVSSWPPDHYMILSAEAKVRQMHLRIPHNQLAMNKWNLKRSDVCLPDPKDKIARALPNPYPYNEDLGDDPSKVQPLLVELKKLKRSVARAKGDGGTLYSKQEEALQVCYSTQVPFNWQAHNASHEVVGIDNSFPESWLNPLLQCLYLCHAPYFPIRRAFVRHLCKREFCVTCEVSILFANMMVSNTHNCTPIVQSSSLLRTLYRIPEFVDSGVLQPPTSRDDAVRRMHLMQRLLLERFDKDLRQCAPQDKLLANTEPGNFGMSIVELFGTEFQGKSEGGIPPCFFWEVPASATKVEEGLQHLLKQLESYDGDQVQIKRLPPIIVLLLNPEHGHLKPPSSLKFSRDQRKEEYNYVLCSNVLHLADDVDDCGLFVSHHQSGSVERDKYFLVNDYVVSPVQSEEQLEACIPATTTHSVVVTYYALDSFRGPFWRGWSNSSGDGLPPSAYENLAPLLIRDELAEMVRRPDCTIAIERPLKSVLQSIHDIQAGDLVAIDAEYVVLTWGNKRADEPEWLRRQRKPNMSLARVSCIVSREDGDERTIIDDYVHTPLEVLDYVTQYSGIHEGDLDPLVSAKHLTSLKATYLKLRALVDRGVRFVGHGLSQDFRVCNIAVPPSQIIDTLELFHRPPHRKLSLRFLAYYVLGERVQEDEHDSVEDARTSLRLYRWYQTATQHGTFEAAMERVIQRGHETNWYVATSDGASSRGGDKTRHTAATPPLASPGTPSTAPIESTEDTCELSEAAVSRSDTAVELLVA